MLDFLGGLVLIAYIFWLQRENHLLKQDVADRDNKIKIISILGAFGIPPELHKFDEGKVAENNKEESNDESA